MSYDLYLYKSNLGRPDIDEALHVIEADDDIWTKKPYNYETKTAIEMALIEADPTLEGFNYEQLAQKQMKSVEVVKKAFIKFGLNSAEGQPEIKIEIYDYHVSIEIPYTYQGERARTVFERLKRYVDVIHKTAGYFVYDPQSGEAFDPAFRALDGLSKYLIVSNDLKVINTGETIPAKKQWWKFW